MTEKIRYAYKNSKPGHKSIYEIKPSQWVDAPVDPTQIIDEEPTFDYVTKYFCGESIPVQGNENRKEELKLKTEFIGRFRGEVDFVKDLFG